MHSMKIGILTVLMMGFIIGQVSATQDVSPALENLGARIEALGNRLEKAEAVLNNTGQNIAYAYRFLWYGCTLALIPAAIGLVIVVKNYFAQHKNDEQKNVEDEDQITYPSIID
jgi:hypothetical protein